MLCQLYKMKDLQTHFNMYYNLIPIYICMVQIPSYVHIERCFEIVCASMRTFGACLCVQS